MIAREGDHEQTTQENVWAIIAPGNWMELTRELQEDYDYAVDLNGEQLLARVVTPRNVRDQQTLHIPIDELTAQCVLLLRGASNSITGLHLLFARSIWAHRWHSLHDQGSPNFTLIPVWWTTQSLPQKSQQLKLHDRADADTTGHPAYERYLPFRTSMPTSQSRADRLDILCG